MVRFLHALITNDYSTNSSIMETGVQKVDCDLEQQTVVVQSDLPRDVILATIKKTGKNVRE
jgi:hypothetical protein